MSDRRKRVFIGHLQHYDQLDEVVRRAEEIGTVLSVSGLYNVKAPDGAGASPSGLKFAFITMKQNSEAASLIAAIGEVSVVREVSFCSSPYGWGFGARYYDTPIVYAEWALPPYYSARRARNRRDLKAKKKPMTLDNFENEDFPDLRDD